MWLLSSVAGALGLFVGSFLNVCSLRWPVDESIVSPGSNCAECRESLHWFDNIPVLSWVLLRAKCRHCLEPISIQYPLVELTTGLVWAGVFAAHGTSWEALRGGVFLTILFGISISDARFYIIPNEFTWGGAALGVALSVWPGGPTWLSALIGGAVGYLVLWLVGIMGTIVINKLSPRRLKEAGVDRAMGGGDIKMMMMVGTFLGVAGVALTTLLGSLLALLVFGPIAAITRRLVPLGVFLAAGGGVTYAWGEPLLDWYFRLVGIDI